MSSNVWKKNLGKTNAFPFGVLEPFDDLSIGLFEHFLFSWRLDIESVCEAQVTKKQEITGILASDGNMILGLSRVQKFLTGSYFIDDQQSQEAWEFADMKSRRRGRRCRFGVLSGRPPEFTRYLRASCSDMSATDGKPKALDSGRRDTSTRIPASRGEGRATRGAVRVLYEHFALITSRS
ncbi:hypothetical protein BDQ17DRAFT_1426068 [Cyathus striatus]|nr:hypothetical protein BDQ17DRAFT_1426068 [Cyathus striatus]